MLNNVPPVREFARDDTLTMTSHREGFSVTITYRAGTFHTRRGASFVARMYARDAGKGTRAAFSFAFVGDGGHTSYVYRLQGGAR